MRLAVWSLCVLVLLSEAGCNNREFTRTPRTGTEQLLLSHALERSMGPGELPSPAAGSVAIEVIGFVGERQILQPGLLEGGPMINSNPVSSTSSDIQEPNPPMLRPTSPDLGVMRSFVEGRLAELGYAPV